MSNYGNFNNGGGYGQHQYQGGGGMPYGANERGHGWPQQGGGYMSPGGGYGPQHGPYGGRGGQYGELLYSEEFAEAVKRVSRESMNELLAQQGYFPGGQGQGGWMPGMQHGMGDPDEEGFEEVLDEIRDAPSSEQHKLIEARFENITPEERKLLMAEAGDCSKRKLAAKSGLSIDRYRELRHGLKYKRKR